VFGKPVVTLETQEGSAHGAALLAMVGTGEFATLAECCRAVIREVDVCEPASASGRAVYTEGHKAYQALYPAIKGLV
jgi:xylulokinase